MADEYIKRSQTLKEISDAYEYEYPTASGAFDDFAIIVKQRDENKNFGDY